MEKKLKVWNGVVEKANADFEANKKEYWSFEVEGQRVEREELKH